MILVSVGTHEASMKRLVQKIDELKRDGVIKEDVIIQTGYTDDYEPKYCEWSQFFPYNKMQELAKECHILITHGGPSSFIMGLQNGKVPIVVPRRADLGEHVNDHQGKFCHAVEEKQGNIIVVDDVDKLADIITNYDNIVRNMPAEMKSNNERFCREFEKIMLDLVAN